MVDTKEKSADRWKEHTCSVCSSKFTAAEDGYVRKCYYCNDKYCSDECAKRMISYFDYDLENDCEAWVCLICDDDDYD